MDLFGQVLQDQMNSAGINLALILETTTFDKLYKLLTIYRYDAMSYLEVQSTSHIQKLGEALANAPYTKTAMSMSV